MIREADIEEASQMLCKYIEVLGGVNPEEWLHRNNCTAYIDDLFNVAVLEHHYKGVYTAHNFFESRGKEALSQAKEMLDFFFNILNVEVLRGLTPEDSKAARWFNRKIGFKSYGIIEYTYERPCELFIITKEEFNAQEKGSE